MQRPHSPHTRFFTSLKHLEKRLKLENNHPSAPSPVSPPPPPSIPTIPQGIINNTQQTDSLGTPIYLNSNNSATTSYTNASNLQESSEVPQQFLSKSPDFAPTNHSLPHGNQVEIEETVDRSERFGLDDDDDVEMLMQLLRLSDSEEINNNVGCDDGFYAKIVGVKGPKSVKEVERLEGWIKHFLNGEKKEPFALAHLLLGKADFVHSGDDCGDGFGGFKFPSTIDEFLQNDPPLD